MSPRSWAVLEYTFNPKCWHLVGRGSQISELEPSLIYIASSRPVTQLRPCLKKTNKTDVNVSNSQVDVWWWLISVVSLMSSRITWQTGIGRPVGIILDKGQVGRPCHWEWYHSVGRNPGLYRREGKLRTSVHSVPPPDWMLCEQPLSASAIFHSLP